MKSFPTGCAGAVMGFVLGIVLTIGALQFLQPSKAPTPVVTPALPGRADLSVTLVQKYLIAQLQQAARASGLPNQAVVTLAPPNILQIAAPFDFNALGRNLSVNATAKMRLSVDKGRVVLVVESVDVGNFSVPKPLIDTNVEKIRAQVEQEINRNLLRALQGTNLRLVNIRITADDLTAEFSQ